VIADMAFIEQGEFLIVLQEGRDQRVLARTEHYELAGAAWTAAVFKFPKENLQLRKKAQIMKRHDGVPKPPPEPEAPDPDLLDWDVNVIRGAKNDFKGTVMAKDHKTAIEVAIKHFQLKDWQIPRLVVRVRTRPVYRR
jgi:hypothetical protein